LATDRRERVLLAMGRAKARGEAARALARVGRVTLAADPYEATARFARRRFDLVVAHVGGWRRSDLRFVSTVRARSRDAGLLLLVPDGARALAAAALDRGADAYLPAPVDPGELEAAARRLLERASSSARAPDAGAAVATLAGEVAHAVNNPLQVLGLLLEEAREQGAEEAWLARAQGEADRVRDVVGLLGAYARLGPPARSSIDLARLLRERVEAAGRAGLVSPRPATREAADPSALADPAQVGPALDAMVRLLAARSEARPVLLRFGVRRPRRAGERFVEAALRAEGVHVPPEEWEALAAALFRTDERTRLPYPGLAVPRRVADAHGGALRLRETDEGTVLVLRLPAAS
jgi:DNA-binding response OmpR family regulator